MSGTPSSGVGASKSWRWGAFTLSSQRLEGSIVVAMAAFGVSVTTDAVTTTSALPKNSVAKATLPKLKRRVICGLLLKEWMTESRHPPTAREPAEPDRPLSGSSLRAARGVHRDYRAE